MLMHDPLRVALLTAKMSPAAGGLSVSVPGLAYGVDAFNDIEMHVLGTKDPADPRAAEAWGNRVHAFTTRGPSALQRAPGMVSTLSKLDPDLIDVQGLWTWVSKVSYDHFRKTHTPYLVTPRGMLDPWARANSAWKKRIFGAFVEDTHLANAHCLRATAEMEAQHFRDAGITAPIVIVPNAIDLPPLRPRTIQKQRRILFLSRIHPKKGIDFLLNAWKSLEPDHPGWELVIAGMDENGYEAKMKELSRKLGLKRVLFLGAVFGDRKNELYRSADLFVLPTHAENFGLVIAEALANEVPVITTKNAPWSRIEPNGCGWWIDLDQRVLTQTMRDAISTPLKRLNYMGSLGRAWIERDFDPQRVARSMGEVYRWLGGRGPKPKCVHL